jgi:solute:Na+ symporter, SSS family
LLVIGLLTLVYTYFGGIRAVVWVDVVQMILYMVGAAGALVVLQCADSRRLGRRPLERLGGRQAGHAGWTSRTDWTVAYTFWAGLFGGASSPWRRTAPTSSSCSGSSPAATSGQSADGPRGERLRGDRAVRLFLIVGLGLWAYYEGRAFARSDVIFATFIIEALPPGVTGLLIAGVFAAAMSSLSSSINALASASAYDFWAPLAKREGDEFALLRAGRVFTLIWAMLLIGVAILYIPMSEGAAAVEVALTIASLVYGGLLGAFFLGIFDRRANQPGVIAGIAVGILSVTSLWIPSAFLGYAPLVGWPWFVLIGTTITMTVGAVVSRFADARRTAPPGGGPG